MGNARTGRGRADRTVTDDLLRATWYLEARARVGCRYGEWWQPEVDAVLAALHADGADGDGSADGTTDPGVLVARLGEARARAGFTDLETLDDVDALVTAVVATLPGAEAPRPAGPEWPDEQAAADAALSGWLSAAEPPPAESRAEALRRSLAAEPGAALVVVDAAAPARAGARLAVLRCLRRGFPGATCHELVSGRRLAVVVPPGPGASRAVAGLRAALHMEPGLGDASLSVWVERVPAPADLLTFARRLAGLPAHPEAGLPGHRHDRRRRSWHAGTSARGGRGRRAAAVFGRLDQLAGAAAVVLLLVLSVGTLRPVAPGEPFVPDAPAPAPALPGGPPEPGPAEPAGGAGASGAGGDATAPAPTTPPPTADDTASVDLGAPLPVAHVVRPEVPTPAPRPPAAHREPATPPPDRDPAPAPPRHGDPGIDSPDPTAPEPGPGADGRGRGRGKATGRDGDAGANRPNGHGWGHPDVRSDDTPGPPGHAAGGGGGASVDGCGPGPRCHTPPVR